MISRLGLRQLLNGMKKMPNELSLPLASTTWDSFEIEAINRVVKTGNFTMGSEVRKFEKEFANYVGSKFAVMFNSGSSANLGLLAAVRYMKDSALPVGSSILVPAVSWSTTYYPVNQLGYKLNFVDINVGTLNIDETKLESALTHDTRAILVVNLLGNPANWESILRFAKKHNLLILEDNCESLGATYGGKATGTFGIGGTFSTFFSHHISTMEGGMVVTDDETLDHTLRSIRAHGWTRDLPTNNHVYDKNGDDWDDLFRFVLPGYNFRPLEIEAAIGLEQLKKLPHLIKARKANALVFKEVTKGLKDILIQVESGESSWFGFSLVLNGKLKNLRRKLIEELNVAGIQSRPIVAGNFTRNPVMKHLEFEELPDMQNADLIHKSGLFVGNHHYDISQQLMILGRLLKKFEDANG